MTLCLARIALSFDILAIQIAITRLADIPGKLAVSFEILSPKNRRRQLLAAFQKTRYPFPSTIAQWGELFML